MALTPTWESTELPVLEAIITLIRSKEPGMPIQLHDVVQAVELKKEAVAHSIQKLSHEHVEVERMDYLAGPSDFFIRDVTPKGLRAAGVWPSEDAAADAFRKALEQQIEEAPEGSPKSKALKSIRDSAKSVTEGTLTAVIAATVKGAAGL